jgi:phosphoglycerate dehydrogenase-like enzyme
MNVLAWSPRLIPMAAVEAHARSTTLDELLERSDVVTLHIVASPETEHLIDARALGRMKPGAVLVNTSRGELVDEEALLTALDAGTIAGAALDVFAQEPLPLDHPLRSRNDVVLSPHVAGFTRETLGEWYQGTVAAVLDHLDGRPPAVLHRNNRPAAQQRR